MQQMTTRPTFSELGKYLNMNKGEWMAQLLWWRAKDAANSLPKMSLRTLGMLIWRTLRNQPLPRRIRL